MKDTNTAARADNRALPATPNNIPQSVRKLVQRRIEQVSKEITFHQKNVRIPGLHVLFGESDMDLIMYEEAAKYVAQLSKFIGKPVPAWALATLKGGK